MRGRINDQSRERQPRQHGSENARARQQTVAHAAVGLFRRRFSCACWFNGRPLPAGDREIRKRKGVSATPEAANGSTSARACVFLSWCIFVVACFFPRPCPVCLVCKKRSCTCYVVVVSLRLSVFFLPSGGAGTETICSGESVRIPDSPLTRQRQRQCQRQLPCGVRQVPPKGPAGPVVVTR